MCIYFLMIMKSEWTKINIYVYLLIPLASVMPCCKARRKAVPFWGAARFATIPAILQFLGRPPRKVARQPHDNPQSTAWHDHPEHLVPQGRSRLLLDQCPTPRPARLHPNPAHLGDKRNFMSRIFAASHNSAAIHFLDPRKCPPIRQSLV